MVLLLMLLALVRRLSRLPKTAMHGRDSAKPLKHGTPLEHENSGSSDGLPRCSTKNGLRLLAGVLLLLLSLALLLLLQPSVMLCTLQGQGPWLPGRPQGRWPASHMPSPGGRPACSASHRRPGSSPQQQTRSGRASAAAAWAKHPRRAATHSPPAALLALQGAGYHALSAP